MMTASDEKLAFAVNCGTRAQELVHLEERLPLEIGYIAIQMSLDPELPKLDGAKNYDDWLTKRFGRKKKTAYRNRILVDTLLASLPIKDVFAMGRTKAYEFSRLPESQRKSDNWQKAAVDLPTSEFKAKVKAYIAAGRPDHREAYKIIRVPESVEPIVKEAIGIAMNNTGAASVAEAFEVICVDYINNPENVTSEVEG